MFIDNAYSLPSAKQNIPDAISINKLVVYKSKRQLLAFSNDKLIKSYTIALGKNPVGPKQFKDDNKTPEGVYKIDNKSAISKYHKNLGISYPNDRDKSFARKNKKDPGGEIKIHGLPNKMVMPNKLQKFHKFNDWTLGCIAVTNDEIDELYKFVKIGTTIIIYP